MQTTFMIFRGWWVDGSHKTFAQWLRSVFKNLRSARVVMRLGPFSSVSSVPLMLIVERAFLSWGCRLHRPWAPGYVNQGHSLSLSSHGACFVLLPHVTLLRVCWRSASAPPTPAATCSASSATSGVPPIEPFSPSMVQAPDIVARNAATFKRWPLQPGRFAFQCLLGGGECL